MKRHQQQISARSEQTTRDEVHLTQKTRTGHERHKGRLDGSQSKLQEDSQHLQKESNPEERRSATTTGQTDLERDSSKKTL